MQSALHVAKFGGSSVADATAMNRCAQVLNSRLNSRVVIISATKNTTNELEVLADKALNASEDQAFEQLTMIRKKHEQMLLDLSGNDEDKAALDQIFEEAEGIAREILLQKELSLSLMDQLYSIGERSSSLLFSRVLKNQFPGREVLLFDARKVIKTDSQFGLANIKPESILLHIEGQLKPLLKEDNIIVTQGFIGSDDDGKTTTLGREGSDYTATILGSYLEANCVEIWTDVPGIATSDPKVVSGTKIIPELSYEQATLMASLGAKVLFSKTLQPVQKKGIPVFVGSSLNAEAGGTLISHKESELPICGITYKERGVESHISVIGKEASQFQCDLVEIDRGEQHKSFMCETEQVVETIRSLHSNLL